MIFIALHPLFLCVYHVLNISINITSACTVQFLLKHSSNVEPKHFAFITALASKFESTKRRGKPQSQFRFTWKVKRRGYKQKAEEVVFNRRGCWAAQRSPIKRLNLISVEAKWKAKAFVSALKESQAASESCWSEM